MVLGNQAGGIVEGTPRKVADGPGGGLEACRQAELVLGALVELEGFGARVGVRVVCLGTVAGKEMGALEGKAKFDLKKFNAAYFGRLAV